MSTAISVLGGVGLFLIGMTVMTEGLKALAGSGLRTVLGKAAATPLRGSIWGAIITLLVQSSSATTMTTIGLVSVVAGMAMKAVAPDAPLLVIPAGVATAVLLSLAVGFVNAILVSLLELSSFITTLAMTTALTGISLTISRGLPVNGLPDAFSEFFGFSTYLGVPISVYVTVILFAFAFVLLRPPLRAPASLILRSERI